MPGPHPKALRERVVAAYNDGQGTYEEIATLFRVGPATVSRWLRLDREGKGLDPLPMGGARHPRKVDAAGEEFLRTALEAVPDSTLAELVAGYAEEFGVEMDTTTMGRSVARMGFTRKRGL